jgi:hypothetical protein
MSVPGARQRRRQVVGQPSPAETGVGVALSNTALFALVLVCAFGIAVIAARTLSARLVQTRQERLKAHLDWVNPTPQTRRKRKLSRS